MARPKKNKDVVKVEKPVRFASNVGFYGVDSGWYEYPTPGRRVEVKGISLDFDNGLSRPLMESKPADKKIIDAFRAHIEEGSQRCVEAGLCELIGPQRKPPMATWQNIRAIQIPAAVEINQLNVDECLAYEQEMANPREDVIEALLSLKEEQAVENDPFAG